MTCVIGAVLLASSIAEPCQAIEKARDLGVGKQTSLEPFVCVREVANDGNVQFLRRPGESVLAEYSADKGSDLVIDFSDELKHRFEGEISVRARILRDSPVELPVENFTVITEEELRREYVLNLPPEYSLFRDERFHTKLVENVISARQAVGRFKEAIGALEGETLSLRPVPSLEEARLTAESVRRRLPDYEAAREHLLEQLGKLRETLQGLFLESNVARLTSEETFILVRRDVMSLLDGLGAASIGISAQAATIEDELKRCERTLPTGWDPKGAVDYFSTDDFKPENKVGTLDSKRWVVGQPKSNTVLELDLHGMKYFARMSDFTRRPEDQVRVDCYTAALREMRDQVGRQVNAATMPSPESFASINRDRIGRIEEELVPLEIALRRAARKPDGTNGEAAAGRGTVSLLADARATLARYEQSMFAARRSADAPIGPSLVYFGSDIRMQGSPVERSRFSPLNAEAAVKALAGAEAARDSVASSFTKLSDYIAANHLRLLDDLPPDSSERLYLRPRVASLATLVESGRQLSSESIRVDELKAAQEACRGLAGASPVDVELCVANATDRAVEQAFDQLDAVQFVRDDGPIDLLRHVEKTVDAVKQRIARDLHERFYQRIRKGRVRLSSTDVAHGETVDVIVTSSVPRLKLDGSVGTVDANETEPMEVRFRIRVVDRGFSWSVRPQFVLVKRFSDVARASEDEVPAHFEPAPGASFTFFRYRTDSRASDWLIPSASIVASVPNFDPDKPFELGIGIGAGFLNEMIHAGVAWNLSVRDHPTYFFVSFDFLQSINTFGPLFGGGDGSEVRQ